MGGLLGWATACAAVLASLFFLYPLFFKIQRRSQSTGPEGIQIISNPSNAKFEIVAVHGLGAHPEYTWTCHAPATGDGPRRRIHLLRDLLTESFPEARILSFAHNSDWLGKAPITTAQEIGAGLLDQLVQDRENRKQRLPIIFIGHSFGGIVIKEALCRSTRAKHIVHDTSGILFLGTPHQGSPLSVFGSVVARVTGFLGSSTGLLFTLQHHSSQLSDLDSRFDDVRKGLKDAIICSIYEKMPTYMLGWLSVGLRSVSTDEYGQPILGASLLKRLAIQNPDKDLHVNISNLFEPRRLRDEKEDRRPRRILIRGRPGVGKTTLCKKIVHDFIFNQQWNKYFTRLLWVPLRNLQGRQERYKLVDLLHDEYFPQYKDPEPLLDALHEECQKPDASGTLFLLDGLDEIWHHQLPGSRGIVQELLKQPNVIVTSRPSVQFLGGFEPFDFELETIGFYSNQVEQYVEQVTGANENTDSVEEAEKFRQIMDFLEQHPLIGDLVRIPVQLDALCFAWDDISDEQPQTMTDLYQAIERRLWNKDARRLGRTSMKHLLSADLEGLMRDEAILLEKLAFAGLLNGLAVFDAKALNKLSWYLTMPDGKTIDQTLRSLSFLRSSDVSSNDGSRRYYFLHLTIQEYFAARHLTRMWITGKFFQLPDTKKEKLSTNMFFSRYKYLEKFDVVWRFMAGLSASNSDQTDRLFKVVQAPPLDLLGPAHYRLLMRCLFEIPYCNNSLRKQLEGQLLDGLVYDCSLQEEKIVPDTQREGFAAEIECPTSIIFYLLQSGEDRIKISMMRSIRSLPIMPTKFVELATSWLADSSNRDLVSEVLLYFSGFLKSSLSTRYPKSTEQGAEDDNTMLLGAATTTLQYQSKLREAVIQAIIVRLNDADPRIRRIAVYCLRDDALKLPGVLYAVVNKLEDPDEGVRRAAVNSLRNTLDLPEVFEAFVARLKDASSVGMNKRSTLEVLQDQLYQPIIIQVLTANLENKDTNVQCATINALHIYQDIPEEILQQLFGKLADKDSHVQRAAIGALKKQRYLPETIVQELGIKLEDTDFLIQQETTIVLFNQFNLPDTVLQKIVAKLQNEDSTFQRAVIRDLDGDSNVSEKLFEVGLKFLEEYPDDEVLIRILDGYLDLPAVREKVVMKLKHENYQVRLGAVHLLESRVTEPSIFQAVVARLEDGEEHPDVKEAALYSLRKCSDLPEAALQAIIALRQAGNQRYGSMLTQDYDEEYYWPGIFAAQSSLPDSILPG
ncbi:armadillo-type protein [Xylaria arbuscula]|nr:armadillo-type protein [Xylaria arbuscula]